MAYFLNVFNGTTWDEFRRGGANVAGFDDNRRKTTLTNSLKPGDILLCYLTRVSLWVGMVEVTGERFRDESRIYAEAIYPWRFPVKPLVILDPEIGVPMELLEGKLSNFPFGAPSNRWSTMVRESLRRYSDEDGKAIADAIQQAHKNPVPREVDDKLLYHKANLFRQTVVHDLVESETVVSVPTPEDDDDIRLIFDDALELDTENALEAIEAIETSHSEIQWRLLDLGSQMGLNVWAPRSDRKRGWKGGNNADIPTMLKALPTQFDAATTTTIENIDVMWFKGNAIVAAFEVEHSTPIYSGLLRMSDLLAMQPNIDIKLYLVGPDDRFAKFTREVPRPTFAYRSKPLHTTCRFLSYEVLCETLESAKDVIKYLTPEFLDGIAVFYDPKDDVGG